MESLLQLRWGNFTTPHIISIILILPVALALYLSLRKRSAHTQTIILFVLSLWGDAAILYNLLMWHAPLENLPLHLCSFNAILLPIAVLTKSKMLNNLLSVFSFGALLAIVMNGGMGEVKIFSSVFLMYYVPHLMELIIPPLLTVLKLSRPSPRCILPCVITTFGLYTGDYFCNLALNNYFITNNVVDYLGVPVRANFMFSLSPDGNPILEILWKVFPCQYFYIYLLLPVIIIAFILPNLPEIIRTRKEKAGRKRVSNTLPSSHK